MLRRGAFSVTKQAHIVSFDDARRVRSSHAAFDEGGRRSGREGVLSETRLPGHTSSRSADSARRNDPRANNRRSAAALGRASAGWASSGRASQGSGTLFADEDFYASLNFADGFGASSSDLGSVASRRADDALRVAAASHSAGFHGARASAASASEDRRAQSAHHGRVVEEYRDDELDDAAAEPAQKRGAFASFADKLRKSRRKKAKEKAGRKFASQYGGEGASDANAGPRAAVYKGEMGSQHKRATRLQEEGSASQGCGSPARKSFSVAGLVSSPRFIAFGGAAVCLALCCGFLYTPAQQYYQELRERDRLAAEYAAIQERNESLEASVAYLSTEEGIEDQARREFGWVKDGERAVSVSGVEVEEESSFTANILSSDIEPPETWYSGILDPLFGVE